MYADEVKEAAERTGREAWCLLSTRVEVERSDLSYLYLCTEAAQAGTATRKLLGQGLSIYCRIIVIEYQHILGWLSLWLMLTVGYAAMDESASTTS
jgi:hypothetical protein